MRSYLGLTSTPFSRTKFAGYLVGLAVLAGASLATREPHQPVRLAVATDGKATQTVTFDMVRFGKSADEVFDGMRAAGVPWFLRRAGITGAWDTSQPGRLILTLSLNGKQVGRYIEHVEAIDPDRTRAYFAFESTDLALVQRLAAPVDTTLDPTALLRAIEAEHVRASLYNDGFRLSVLKPNAPLNLLAAFTSGVWPDPPRNTDTFPLTPAEQEEATIRHAYRTEAELSAPNP